MPKEKRSITITISDVDNVHATLVSLDNLFRTLLEHYIDKEDDFISLDIMTLACANYFGEVLKLIGFSEKDFEEPNGELND